VVPRQFVQDGQIVLNVLPSAVRDFLMGDSEISFSARFGGVPMQVRVPYAALVAIFAKENAMGMGFGMEPGADYYERLQPVQADESAGVPNRAVSAGDRVGGAWLIEGTSRHNPVSAC
jgi:stringent starvation protein B